MKFENSLVALLVVAGSSSAAETASNASQALDNIIKALGGSAALNAVQGLTLQTSIFSSRSPQQSYDLDIADVYIAQSANQTVSYQFVNGYVNQRTDRNLTYDNYWHYAHRSLALDFSLVVNTGSNASACFNEGGNDEDPSVPFGYADPYLTDYLVHTAEQTALFNVVKQFDASRSQLTYSTTHDNLTLNDFPTLTLPGSGLAILAYSSSYLPYAIRSREQNQIYGNSTNDIVFSNYASVKFGPSNTTTIQFPGRIQTVYNSKFMLEDFIVTNVTINPSFPAGFFTANPPSAGPPSSFQLQSPQTSTTYPRSEVHEFYEAGLWFGPFGAPTNLSRVHVAPLFPGGSVPQLLNVYVDPVSPPYVFGIIEFEDGILITEGPPHRGEFVLAWLAQNMPGKKVTHVVPSHHHRDHAGGIGAYLSQGAALVIPEIAKDYYNAIGNFTKILYSASKPFVKKDKNIQFMSFFSDSATHADDWTWSAAGPVCAPGYNKSEVVLFNADVINPSPGPDVIWDIGEAQPFFLQAVEVGIPREAQLVGVHGFTPVGLGTQDSFANLADIGGFPYPSQLSSGRQWC